MTSIADSLRAAVQTFTRSAESKPTITATDLLARVGAEPVEIPELAALFDEAKKPGRGAVQDAVLIVDGGNDRLVHERDQWGGTAGGVFARGGKKVRGERWNYIDEVPEGITDGHWSYWGDVRDHLEFVGRTDVEEISYSTRRVLVFDADGKCRVIVASYGTDGRPAGWFDWQARIDLLAAQRAEAKARQEAADAARWREEQKQIAAARAARITTLSKSPAALAALVVELEEKLAALNPTHSA